MSYPIFVKFDCYEKLDGGGFSETTYETFINVNMIIGVLAFPGEKDYVAIVEHTGMQVIQYLFVKDNLQNVMNYIEAEVAKKTGFRRHMYLIPDDLDATKYKGPTCY